MNALRFLMTAGILIAAASPAQAKTESWYWTLGFGYAIPGYPNEMDDAIRSMGMGSSTPLDLDLGFYWPVGSQTTVLGVSANALSESFDDMHQTAYFQTGVFLSAMHAFGDEPGAGVILRGDAGLTHLSISTSNPTMETGGESGFGLNGGIGYGFKISDGTRLTLMTIASFRRIDGNTFTPIVFNVGLIF